MATQKHNIMVTVTSILYPAIVGINLLRFVHLAVDLELLVCSVCPWQKMHFVVHHMTVGGASSREIGSQPSVDMFPPSHATIQGYCFVLVLKDTVSFPMFSKCLTARYMILERLYSAHFDLRAER